MAEHDVAKANLIMSPAMGDRQDEFKLFYTVEDGSGNSVPGSCIIKVTGSPVATRIVKSIIAEVNQGVNHATTAPNLNSASVQTVIGALPV